ncbi:MAG: bifunctional DNA primase/polymerase [Candidatus Korobacteraceae bacterium]
MTTRKSSSQLHWALRYARMGLPVFPCKPGGKEPLTPHAFKDATTNLQQIRKWWRLWPEANIGLATGSPSGLMALDLDPRNGGETSWRDLRAGRTIPKTAKQGTGGGGRHIFFRNPGGIRCGTLAPGVDVKAEGGYVIVPPSVHPSGETYRWLDEDLGGNALLEPAVLPDWLLARLRSGNQRQANNVTTAREVLLEGQRNNGLTSLAGIMRHRGMSQESIEAAILTENQKRCDPPLDEDEVHRIAESVSRYEPGNPRTSAPSGWPSPLNEDAFHGVAGDLVRMIEPHSEADPAALLIQCLVAAGNVIGRTVHFYAEADQHYTNLFSVLVGRTAKGRKGTSLGHIQRVFAEVDPAWSSARTVGGLSTGEGLIFAVRDEVRERKEIRKKGRITAYKEVVTDPGVTDKRLLVVEPEFARVLQVCERETNTLSAVIRQSWDSGLLRIITKNKPASATGAHISIIAHITKDELRRLLTTTAVANGFANRFLWVCASRSKMLPDGGRVETVDFEPLIKKLRDAGTFAKESRELRRTKQARALWHEVYEELSTGKPGLLGSVTSRAEPQVMRLACVYAVLDCSPTIRVAHLRAALEVWRYSEQSARFVFGDAVGDWTADKILRALRKQTQGLTRNAIRELFNRDKSSTEIERALGLLQENGLARMVTEQTGKRGRPCELWFAI